MKVLICGHPLYRYLDSVSDGFKSNGWSSKIFEHKNTNVLKLLQKGFVRRLKNKSVLNKINRQIKKQVLAYEPDLFLIINGEVLFEETILWLNKRCKTALWLVDGAENVKLPRKSMNLFSCRFVLEPTDETLLTEATYLPYACDPTVYSPLPLEQKKYDISFVGAGHEDRLIGLNDVAKFASDHDFNFSVFGPFGVFKDVEKQVQYEYLYKSIVFNGKLTPSEVNKIYNQTFININSHHSQSKEGVNTRVFEILGTKSIQLVENKPYLDDLFTHMPSLFTYGNMEELTSNILEIMKSPESCVTDLGNLYDEVKENHSFVNRTKTIIETFEGLS